MLNPELWAEGAIAMVIGMGIVFSFLVLLVFAMLIMTKCVAFVNKICPVPVAESKKTAKVSASDDSEVATAIAIAYSKM